jgi:hypothetical protein
LKSNGKSGRIQVKKAKPVPDSSADENEEEEEVEEVVEQPPRKKRKQIHDEVQIEDEPNNPQEKFE